MSLVEVSELQRSFRAGPGTEDVIAADRVSFSIESGEALGLVGESGSGKSTIARILVGLERADGGEVVIDGVDRLRRPRSRGERLARARAVQMVFQDPNGSLDRRMTVKDALRSTLRMNGGATNSSIDHRIKELLDQVRLAERHATSKPHELSGGQRQRVAIARALALTPKLVVLDEPVSALDVSVQAQVLELLAEIQRESGVSYLFVSHDLAVIRELCSRVLVLFRGAVVEQGKTGQVLTSPEHSYSKLLIASTPGPGWDPEQVVRDRMTFTQRMEIVRHEG